MQNAVKSILDTFASKGTTLTKVLEAVKYGLNWLSRQPYASELKDAYRNLSFTVGGIPNFGVSGGTLTITKNAGDSRIFGSSPGNSRFEMTVEGLVQNLDRLNNGGNSAEVAAAAEAAAAAERAAQQAAEAARQARAKHEELHRQHKERGASLVNSFRSFVGR